MEDSRVALPQSRDSGGASCQEEMLGVKRGPGEFVAESRRYLRSKILKMKTEVKITCVGGNICRRHAENKNY